MKWICQGLNSINRDKNKRYQDESDPDSAWSRDALAAFGDDTEGVTQIDECALVGLCWLQQSDIGGDTRGSDR